MNRITVILKLLLSGILISHLSLTVLPEEQTKRYSGMVGCHSSFWIDYYNKLAEALILPCILANVEPPYCQGYSSTYANRNIIILDGGDGKWDTSPLIKGKNNDIYIHLTQDSNGGYATNWNSSLSIWQDMPSGKHGIYDLNVDRLIYTGTYPLKDGDRGRKDSFIYYNDLNTNGLYDVGEEVWNTPIYFDNHSAYGYLRALQNKIIELLSHHYLNFSFANNGDLSGLDHIPFMLDYDANGKPTSKSIKLFPEREGDAAYYFTVIPATLEDGTTLCTAMYSNTFLDSMICPMPALPVHFEEIRQVLNKNLFRWSSTFYGNITNTQSENNKNAESCSNASQISLNDAYSKAIQQINSFSAEESPFASIYSFAQATTFIYSFQNMRFRKWSFQLKDIYDKYKPILDIYIKASSPDQGTFNNFGDNRIIEGKWNRFCSVIQNNIDGKYEYQYESTIQNPPFPCNQNATDGFSTKYLTVFKFEGEYSFPHICIGKPNDEAYANDTFQDSDRDDITDIGITIDSFDSETGTIVFLPDMDEPLIVIPLMKLSNGIMNCIFYKKRIYEYYRPAFQNIFTSSQAVLDNMQDNMVNSINSYSFPDLFWNIPELNIRIKRIAIVRPRGQVVVFDFPWDAENNKYSDVGVPIGIHKNRTYRLTTTDYFQNNDMHLLQFQSGFSIGYNDKGNTLLNRHHDLLSVFESNDSLYYYNAFPSYWTSLIRCVYYGQNSVSSRNYDISFEWDKNKIFFTTKDGMETIETELIYNDNGDLIKLHKKVPASLSINGKTDYDISIQGDTIIYPTGITVKRTQTATAGNSREVTITKNDSNSGQIISKYKYNTAEMLEEASISANGDTEITKYEYCPDNPECPKNRSRTCQKIRSIISPDGSWKYYQYDTNGWISKVYSPFKSSFPFPCANGIETEYIYEPHLTDTVSEKLIFEKPRTIIERINCIETAKNFLFLDTRTFFPHEIHETAVSPFSTWGNCSNLRDESFFDFTFNQFGHLPKKRINMLSSESFIYSSEGYQVAIIDDWFPKMDNSKLKTISTLSSYDNSPIQEVTTTVNSRGIIEAKTVMDQTSGMLIDKESSQVDSFDRKTKTVYFDGTTEIFSDYCLYGPRKYIDRNDNITFYTYNVLGQVIKEETLTATITRTYDALGNVTRITTVPKGNGETTSEAWTYDAMSRITSHTDSFGKTTYTYTGTKTEIRYPDGTDQTIQKNLDGSIDSVYGSAVAPISYDYGVDPAKGRWVKEMRGSTWTMTYYNMLGQAHRTETSTGYWTQNNYGSAGRQNGSYDSEGRTSSTTYNSKNEIASQTVNGITADFTNSVIQKNGKTVLQKTSTVHNSTGNIISVDESAVTGWEQWNTVNGRTTHTVTTLKGAGNYTTVTTDFEGNISKDEISRKSCTKNINNLASFTSERDGLGRTVSISDSRIPYRSTYTYRPNTDQIASVFSSDGSKSTYKYADRKYEPSGFVPPGESKALGLRYTDTGLLEKIIGSSVFDALNIYDSLNRQTGLNTNGEAGSALTTLVYDDNNSQLKEKSIAGQKCYAFEYEADGRIKTFRKNINGSEAAKTMHYTQAPNFFNSGYTWSDGTPSVSIDAHDSFGQPGSIETAGICTQEFTRNADSQITGVEFSSNLTENKNVSYEYQNLRRSQMTSGNDVVSYTYESGRMKVISAGSVKANYVYEPGTLNLVKEITIEKGATVALIRDISWQGNADRISSVINKSAAGQIYNSFSYQYNPNGKIAKIAKEDGTAWQYSYDERGQLENASRYRGAVKLLGNEFAFISDSIGNICDAGKKKKDGSKSVKFTPTLFNTISTRVVGDKLEVSGSAIPEATISVNNVKASRKDNEFVSTVDAKNADSAVSLQLNVVGTYYDQHEIPEVGGGQLGNAPGADVVSTVTGKALIPKSSENPVYDIGGRLVSTSLWYYFWNSEDRLVSVESTPTISASGRVKLEFAYDHAGRRIRKQVYRKNSPTDNWSLITNHFFYYDQVLLNGHPSDLGLLTNETIISNETNGTTNTTNLQYLWGLDLNGIYQGLGGIGGLLAVIDKTHSKVYLPCSDAKGTIHSYIDADTGTTVAKFAYDPYGKITSSSISSDCSPHAFSITFQSKYYDSELQSYYFGFRYYDPATCRWLNRDPLGESGGLNLYAFCDNDPVNGMDYLGCVWYNPLDSDFCLYTAGYNTGLHIYETGYSPVRAGKRMLKTGASWDLINPSGKKFFAYETLDGGLDAVRVAGGLPISYLSLDIFGRQEESSFTQGKPLIGFNGMWNTEDDIIDFRDRFRNKFGISSRQINNQTGLKTTSFFPTAIIDSFQIIGNEFGLVDITAIHGARALRDANEEGNIINVVAHSQGTMTFYRALDLVDEPEIRSKIRYQGVGGEMFISQKYLGLESARNGWNRETGSSLSQRLLNVSSFGLFGDSLKYDLVPVTNYMPSPAKLMGAKFNLPGYGSWETPNSSENINKNGGANHGYYGNSHGIYYYDEWFNVNW